MAYKTTVLPLNYSPENIMPTFFDSDDPWKYKTLFTNPTQGIWAFLSGDDLPIEPHTGRITKANYGSGFFPNEPGSSTGKSAIYANVFTGGNTFDPDYMPSLATAYVLAEADPTTLRQRSFVRPFLDGGDVITNLYDYARKGFHYKLPRRCLRVIFNGGWFGSLEHEPLQVHNTDIQNYYLDDQMDVDELEISLDYYTDLWNAIKSFGLTEGVQVDGEINPIPFTESHDVHNYPLSLDSNNHIYNHPARWMRSLCKGTPGPTNFKSGNGRFPIMYGDPTDYVFEELFEIIFVTDGLQIYHGYSNDYGTDDIEEPTTYFDDDLTLFLERKDVFRRYGALVVCSPKNASYYPSWIKGDGFASAPFLDPWCLCLDRVHDHLVAATSAMDIDLRMRNYESGAPTGGPSYLPWRWTEDQVSVSEIMGYVEDFYS